MFASHYVNSNPTGLLIYLGKRTRKSTEYLYLHMRKYGMAQEDKVTEESNIIENKPAQVTMATDEVKVQSRSESE